MSNPPPMEKGLPLDLALRRWTHPRLIAKLDKVERQAAERPHDPDLKKEAKAFRAKLESDFIAALLVGSNQFWISAYLAPVTPISQRGEVS
jgi:F0F1-type ATP synthase assembly protein I